MADRAGRQILPRDIERRLAGFARGCADPALVADIVAAATSTSASPSEPDADG